ncbi:hypothetical protein D3C81_1105550 [compost metagenome]
MRQQTGILRHHLHRHTRAKGAPAGAGAEPLALRIARQRRLLWRQYGFAAGQTHFAVFQAIAAPVDLVHARVDGRRNLHGAMLAMGALGEDRQVGNRQHRALQRERQSLHHADGDAHAGEGAGAAAKGDGVQRGEGDARLVQQILHHRQQTLRVHARNHLVTAEPAAVMQQGDGTGFGRGIQGQEGGHRLIHRRNEKGRAL